MTSDDDDPFWVAAFAGSELMAREELMPDREQEEVMEAALRLNNSEATSGADREQWSPAEVRVTEVSVPGLPVPICIREVLQRLSGIVVLCS